jgi:integrase
LQRIDDWLRGNEEHGVADLVCFLGYSGLRIGEALRMEWEMVDWPQGLLHVKKGIYPWVKILPEMETLLRGMQGRTTSYLLFASRFDPENRRCVRDQEAAQSGLRCAGIASRESAWTEELLCDPRARERRQRRGNRNADR